MTPDDRLHKMKGLPGERYYTVKEAAAEYFQGKVSARAVYVLFTRGHLRGFRVGSKILIYLSSLDAYRASHQNDAPQPEEPPPAEGNTKPARNPPPAIRLNRLPEG
jgi:excisionase family DNA binding protein